MGQHKEILSLALPAIITNITTPLLSLVDVAIVGHMGNAAYIGAIAIGGSMFNMLYWLFGFLRMGSSGLTAQAYGAGDAAGQSRILRQALLVALLAASVMIILQKPLCDATLRFMEVDRAAGDMAATYFYILIWGAPAVLGNFSICGWLLGMQNSKATMWISIFINLCNITVSCVLVYGFHCGIRGVAAGTLSAQWAGLLLGLWIAMRHYRLPGLPLAVIVQWQSLKRFFKVNTDIFLRTVCLVAVTIWFTRVGARQGDVMLAVNALLMQFFTLFSFFMDGFAFAGEALTGKYIGRNDYKALHSGIMALCKWGIGIAALFTLLYIAGGDLLLHLLSDDCDVVEMAGDYMKWVFTIPAVGFLAFTWDGIFVGATATRAMLVSMICATVVFFTIYMLLFPSMGNDGLWIAFLAYLLTRGLVLTVIGRITFRHGKDKE